MGSMQIQDAFEPYYEANVHPTRPDQTRQTRREKQSFLGLRGNETGPSADVVARLARCRDTLARSLSKRGSGR